MSIFAKIVEVQSKLKAPKSQWNKFGKYHYRSCEDIVEGVKPLLKEHGLAMILGDTIEMVGDRYYIKAAVMVVDIETGDKYEVCGWARESEDKKGMDASQITGAASSYARKYALNGMFAIDDTKDADSTNDHGNGNTKKTTATKPTPPPKKESPTPKKEKTKPSDNGNMATEKQLKAIFAIGKGKGLNADQIKQFLISNYSVSSSKEMTKKQASETIEAFNDITSIEEFEEYVEAMEKAKKEDAPF